MTDPSRDALAVFSEMEIRGLDPTEATARLRALGPGAAPALHEALRARSAGARRAAIAALLPIATRASVVPLLRYAVEAPADESNEAALAVRAAIEHLTPPDGPVLAPLLRRLLRSTSAWVRMAAADAIALLDLQELDDALQDVAADVDPDVARHGALARVRLAGGPDAAAWIEALTGRDPAARDDATDRILAAPRAASLLAPLLTSPDNRVLREVLRIAELLRAPEMSAPIARLALRTRDPEIRAQALRAIPTLPDDVAEGDELMRRAALASDWTTRAEAAALALRSDRPALLAIVEAILVDPDPWIRTQVAERWVACAGARHASLIPAVLRHVDRLATGRGVSVPEADAMLLDAVRRVVEDGGRIPDGVEPLLERARVAPAPVAESAASLLARIRTGSNVAPDADHPLAGGVGPVDGAPA